MIRSFLKRSLLAGAVMAAAGPAYADVKAGVDAWSRGDYATAIQEWKGPADKGDADAQFNLGQAYKLGRGVPQDLAKAEALFAKAAASGHMQASDNYGLLLFQRGERARALPYVTAAADRGDPRAQYLLGLAYFNGENVTKDWVRAYALVSLAQRSGLAQAVPALAEMDKHIPLEQRQQSVKLAANLAAAADATRARQLAALDLGAGPPKPDAANQSMSVRPKSPVTTPVVTATPSTSGADYTRPKPPTPKIPAVADILDATPAPAPVRPAPPRPLPGKPAVLKPAPVKPVVAVKAPLPKPMPTATAVAAKPAPVAASTGGVWRIQLGAFGVPGNADALWNRVKGRPELAGHARINAPAGRLTKLQAGGFAGQGDAQNACRRLNAAGFTCIAVRN